MSKPVPAKSRTVIEPTAHFDLSQTSLSSQSLSSLAISTISDSHLRIYAGTDSGTLIALTLDPSNGESIKLSRYVSISHSPIVSIHVAAQIGKILVVSDGFMFVVDVHLQYPVKKLSVVKGVSAVARRLCQNSESLALNWVQEEGFFGDNRNLMKRLGSGIRSNGMRPELGRDYSNSCIFSLAAGKRVIIVELILDASVSVVVLKEMQGLEGVKTIAWLDDSIILGTHNGYSLMSCVTGEITLIFSLPDVGAAPCLKLLRKAHEVLLLVDNAGIIVDGHGLPVGGSLVFRHAPDSLVELSSYVAVARGGKVELYHKRSGASVQTLSFEGIGGSPCFLADEEDANGEHLAVAASSKVFCYHTIPWDEQIKDLLRKKNFKEAIALVEEHETEGDISKERLHFVHAQIGFLLLFDLHFEEAVNHFLLSETMQPSEIFPFVIRDPNRWSLLVPRNRYWGLHPPPAHIEDVVEDGLLAIQRASFLKKAGVETAIDHQFLLNPPSRAELLELAFKNIIRYLQATRSKDLSTPVKEGVDTLLMFLYRTLNCAEDMEKLATSDNSCVVEELETLLEESGHLRTLAFLYAKKGMSSKALAIWRVLARSYPSGLHQGTAGTHYLNGTSSPNVSFKETAAVEASKILEESADAELVLQHLGWISEVSEELAVQILTSERRTNPLPPDDVLASIDPRKVEILQRYLQWLIENQDSSDTQLHTLYALSLAKSALETLETETSVKNSHNRTVEDVNNHGLGINRLPEDPVRGRLQFFLHSSDLYDAEVVLELVDGSEFWLEKAILYRKLGQETSVLQILALKLEDSEAAEQYCAELGRPDAYMQLLDMYLNPLNGKGPMFKAAVRLIHNHGESLDPLQVLERLSPDMPLQLASETILRMLRARHHHHHLGKIVHSLCRAVDVDARLSRLEERARHVQINDESLCDSCHARLGTKLFAMYPDDSIVCYKCYRRQGEATSVTGRNFKKDTLIKPGWLVSR